jgi:1-acyl-sn-glycerol-3-phosphate acyltransferase
VIERFPGDSYSSPPDAKRPLREWLLLGSRWSPYSLFFGTMFRYRALALEGRYDAEAWVESSIEVLREMEACGAKVEVSGMDALRAIEGPAVFVSNHMSTMETLVLPGFIAPIKPVTFVVKRKLTVGPFWGPIMQARDPIIVDRKDPRRDLETVLSEGAKHLGAGRSVVIFPQGTRTELFDRAKFNSLGVKLALRCGVPIVPIALKTDFWGNSPLFRGFGPIRRSRPVHFRFGAALWPRGRGKAEHEAVLGFIESALLEWGAPVARTGGGGKEAEGAD